MDIKRITILIAAILSMLSLSVIAFFWNRLPKQVPLYYSRPWGEDQLVEPGLLFLPFGFSLLILLINFTWSKFWGKNELLSAILLVTALLSVFLSTIAIIKIIILIV